MNLVQPTQLLRRDSLTASFAGALAFALLIGGCSPLTTPAASATPEVTQAPVVTLSATSTPEPTPTPDPDLEPEPTLPMPLADLYPQTTLTAEQIETIQRHNENASCVNVLLLGVDRRGTSGASRTDTMMIATIDKVNKRVKLTSIMRDLLVDIPGHGESRINRAATLGGIDLLRQTIDQNLHIRIDGYVLVDFRMFEKIIDEIGGVTVRMTAEEISAANDCIAGLNKQWGVEYLWDGFIFAEAGNVKLTGTQALGYARVRKIDSDFSRTNRQFKLLNAVYAKMLKSSRLYDILYDVMPLVETDLDNAKILAMAVDLFGLYTKGLLHYTIPAEGTYKSTTYDGSSVLLADLSQNAWLAHDFIFEAATEPDEAKVLQPGPSLPPRTPSLPGLTSPPEPGTSDELGFGGLGF